MKEATVAILMAMHDEAAPVIKRLNLSQSATPFPKGIPFETFEGQINQARVVLVTAGLDPVYGVDNVATQPATLLAYLTIQHFQPDLIINPGTAGGFLSEGCQIGDVYLSSDEICYHDRRIPLPMMDRYGVGHYKPHDTTDIAKTLHLKQGRVSTGNSLHHSSEDIRVMKENGAIIKEMEAAAIAWVCQIQSTPMFTVKSVTDLLDQGAETEEQFVANLKLAVTNLGDTLPAVIEIAIEELSKLS